MKHRVAIVIPALNEAERIGALLSQFSQETPELVVDILVADGGSRDGTRTIVRNAARNDHRIRLIDNPAIIQSAGINRAVALAKSEADILIRVDAHADYPDDFIGRIVQAFDRTGAAMIAVRLDSRGTTARQRGIAAASNSRLGTGGSAHRMGGFSGFIDHGHHAGISRTMFERIGGYDESFVANEDAEFDARVRAAGGRIWMAGDIAIVYHPRSTFGALFGQYRRYGRGRAQNWAKHGERLRVRQIAPVAIVGLCSSAIAAVPIVPAMAAIPLGYLAMVCAATIALLPTQRRASTLLAAPAMVVMHWAWGIGFIGQAVTHAIREKPARTDTIGADAVMTEQRR